MIARTKRRGPVTATIEVKKRKTIQGGFQTFDQKSVFSNTEESAGNLLGVVKKGGKTPLIQVMSNATLHIRDDWPIHLRNQMQPPKKPQNEARPSPFRKTLSTIKSPEEAEDLQPGDVIELESTMVDYDETALFPWNYRRICSLGSVKNTLLMPECLATLIVSSSGDGESSDYRIAIAARAEAEEIPFLWDGIDQMRNCLGNKDPMVNGFILRGTSRTGGKEKQGLTCFRTRSDDENNLTDDEVILNFINNKAQKVINKISSENPWEFIPLYIVRPTSLLKARLEGLARRFPQIATSETSPYEASFAHCNVVLDFTSNPDQPSARSFSLSRTKPLILEAGIPERAVEKKLTVFKPDAGAPPSFAGA